MARYVCKCGGHNRFCTICWGERFYTPKGVKEEIPARRDGPPQEISADATEPTANEEATSTDAST